MIKIGWTPNSPNFHVIDEKNGDTQCKMASLSMDSARDKNSNSLIADTEVYESMAEAIEDMKPMRVCSHCEDKINYE